MRHLRILALVAMTLFAASACKSQYDLLLEGSDSDAKYKAAFDYFNQGKYQKAAQLFESLAVVSSNTSRGDTVLYYWGLSNYSAKDYFTAETNFDNYLQNNSKGAFAENAKFLRLDCLYKDTLRYELDQTPTYKAITAISEYMIEHPTGVNYAFCKHMLEELEERLDRKAYENAKLYYKTEYYKAARVAFKNILKDDADNVFREDILYYTAMSSYKYADMSIPEKQKERFLSFLDDYYNFIGEYPESNYRKELDRLYTKVKNK